MKTLLSAALCIFLLQVSALAGAFDKPSDKPVQGSFLVSVDDHASIYVNGQKVFGGNLGTSRSKELELKVGDQIVVHLVNDVGARHFIMVFVSTDQERIVSFKATDLHIVTEMGVNSFRPEQLAGWTKTAHLQKGHKGLEKMVKNYSDWVWGDLDRCALASVVTPAMITARPR